MRKYRVLQSFIDKNTRIGYNEGSTFSSDDEERIAFLASKGYLFALLTEKEIDAALLAEAKALKIKGYTKMNEENLREAIEAEKAKKASEADGNATD